MIYGIILFLFTASAATVFWRPACRTWSRRIAMAAWRSWSTPPRN